MLAEVMQAHSTETDASCYALHIQVNRLSRTHTAQLGGDLEEQLVLKRQV